MHYLNNTKIMKNIIYILLSLLLLSSCSSGLESKAKKHLHKYIEEFAHNPETYEIKNMKTVYNNDSVCIIQFTGIGENLLGGHKSTHYEYIYIRTKNDNNTYKDNEVLVNLNGETEYNYPILKQCDKLINLINSDYNYDLKEYRSQLIYITAQGKALLHGRTVTND